MAVIFDGDDAEVAPSAETSISTADGKVAGEAQVEEKYVE
jgi:hypothetical protein